MRRRLLPLLPPPSRAPFSCARFGDDRSATADCGGAVAAVCWACFARMNSSSLLALRRWREFGLLGEQAEGLCALAVPAPAVSPAGAWRVLPAFSPAPVRASSGLLGRVLPCTLVLRRGRWLSGDPVGVDVERCALAVPPPAACPTCTALGIALLCPGPQHALWNLKLSFTPWISTECNSPSAPSLRARRISCQCCLPSRVRPGALGVPACTPRLAERS